MGFNSVFKGLMYILSCSCAKVRTFGGSWVWTAAVLLYESEVLKLETVHPRTHYVAGTIERSASGRSWWNDVSLSFTDRRGQRREARL